MTFHQSSVPSRSLPPCRAQPASAHEVCGVPPALRGLTMAALRKNSLLQGSNRMRQKNGGVTTWADLDMLKSTTSDLQVMFSLLRGGVL